MMVDLSDNDLAKFKAICEKEGIKYETEAENREAANNLVGFFDLLIRIDQEDKGRQMRLKYEPKGFSMAGQGRNCSLCRRGVYSEDGWYDKWGFKCLNCPAAVDKKKIPGSLCGDYDNKKCITDSDLSYKSKLHIQTIRGLPPPWSKYSNLKSEF